MKYFTSDLHLGHKNILRYDDRPYKDLEEMEVELIKNINDTVKPHDELYILGDISMNMKPSKLIPIIDRIKCKNLFLVRGNHDTLNEELKKKFLRVDNYLRIHHVIENENEEVLRMLNVDTHNRIKLIMMHYPIISWDGKENGSIHLHGHVHKGFGHADFFHARKIDVGCMHWVYKPVSIDQIIDVIAVREKWY